MFKFATQYNSSHDTLQPPGPQQIFSDQVHETKIGLVVIIFTQLGEFLSSGGASRAKHNWISSIYQQYYTQSTDALIHQREGHLKA